MSNKQSNDDIRRALLLTLIFAIIVIVLFVIVFNCVDVVKDVTYDT